MSEQETVKVYELAKELGIDSLSLLDKLKALHLNVKNHMSELGAGDVQVARASFKKGGELAKASTKKTGAKTTAAKTTATKATAAKTTVPKVAASAIKTRKRSITEATPATPEPAAAAKTVSPVIRRRVKADGVTETVSAPIPGYTRSPSEEQELADADTHEFMVHADGSAEPSQHFEMEPEAPMGSEYEATEHLTSEPQTTEISTQDEQVESPTPSPFTPLSAQSENTGTMTAMTSAPSPTPAPPKPQRPPIVLPPRPVAPRRSILKVVDLTPPPQRPMIKPPTLAIQPKTAVKPGTVITGNDKDFRVFKMTKENLDQMVEEEAAKKRGGGGRVPEIRPEDVRFADYRKKEMVFLPKRKRLPVGKTIKRTEVTQAAAHKRVVEMGDSISVQDLANQLATKSADVIRKLMTMGVMASLNQTVDFDTATLVAAEYQYEVKNVAFKEATLIESTTDDAVEKLVPRPPVVTIMGHVDHGKTTLLDAIREANVAGGEAGGITQHIGAYTVDKNGKLITFIDTPGHEAFSVMRARGANVTDLVVLVVSADDGVMPQTREAVSHAQAAKVPIIVAVNKIDKPGANPEKIKQGLSELNLLAEDWGGQTMFVPVSALKKTNLDKLLDSILLQAEVLDLKANPDARASGTVLEARLEKGRGPMVSVLVSRGTLKVGDAIVSGSFSGKVRALSDHLGRTVESVSPGMAVEILGFEGVPNAGEKFNATTTEADARKIAETRIDANRAKISGSGAKLSLEDLFSKVQSGDVKELNVILKADVFGSCEAIKESLIKASTQKVKVKVIYSAPGGITESDILLASASNAVIIGFNVRPETKARLLAEAEHVDIKTYTIIYQLLDDIKLAMTGLLDKKKVEKFLGRAEVRQIFSVPKIGTVAGTSVIDGKILRGANVRLLRDSRVIFDGKMASLRRFKDDAKEVATGFECGIGLENYNDLKPGDIIEAYQIDLITPELGV
ncbi:translation initiation factor IF-2 [Bdellovibrionota bacterium FG-1]